MIGSTLSHRVYAYGGPVDMRKGFGAPGQAWCFQRVRFPSRQGVEPLHRELSLGPRR